MTYLKKIFFKNKFIFIEAYFYVNKIIYLINFYINNE